MSTPDRTNLTDNACNPEFLTFSLIMFMAKTSKKPGLEIPRILGAIVKDATLYFLVMFTSHVVLMITLVFARVSRLFFSLHFDQSYSHLFLGRNSTCSSFVSRRR